MEEACRSLGAEVAGLRVLLQIAREEADHYRLLANKQRSVADDWKLACHLAQEISAKAVQESETAAAALADAEARLKHLERQGRRRRSTSSLP